MRDRLMVIEMSSEKIRLAVKECLVRCYQGNTPLGVIAEFRRDLQESGWLESEIRQVEQTVRTVLAGMSEFDDE
jgi:hypothetical protein